MGGPEDGLLPSLVSSSSGLGHPGRRHRSRLSSLKSSLKSLRVGEEGKEKIEAEDEKSFKKASDVQELQPCCEVTGKHNLIMRWKEVMVFARLERDFPVIGGRQGSLLLAAIIEGAQTTSLFLDV